MKYFHYLLRALVIGLLGSSLAYYFGYGETIDRMIQVAQSTSVYQAISAWHKPLEAVSPIFGLGIALTLALILAVGSFCILTIIDLKTWWSWRALNRKYQGQMNAEQWELFFARFAVKEAYFREGLNYLWARDRWNRSVVDGVLIAVACLGCALPYKLFPAESIDMRLVFGLASMSVAISLAAFYQARRFAELSYLPHGLIDRYLEEDRHLDVSESPSELLGLQEKKSIMFWLYLASAMITIVLLQLV